MEGKREGFEDLSHGFFLIMCEGGKGNERFGSEGTDRSMCVCVCTFGNISYFSFSFG